MLRRRLRALTALTFWPRETSTRKVVCIGILLDGPDTAAQRHEAVNLAAKLKKLWRPPQPSILQLHRATCAGAMPRGAALDATQLPRSRQVPTAKVLSLHY